MNVYFALYVVVVTEIVCCLSNRITSSYTVGCSAALALLLPYAALL